MTTVTGAELSHREAEAFNLEMVDAGPARNRTFLLVPVGLVHGHPERPMVTPRFHCESRSGGYLGKYMQNPSISSGARRSGSSGTRAPRGPRGNAGAVAEGVAAIAGQKRALPAAGGPLPGSMVAGRTKRPSIAPPRISAGTEGSIKQELKEAKKLIKELMNHRSAWPFNQPVDVVKFPNYYQLIEHPIDMGTMKKRLDSGHYADLDQFAADMKRMWTNCYSFNQDPNSDVCKMAKELETIADEKIRKIPELLEQSKKEEKKEKETDQMKSMKQQMKMMQQMLAMQQQMMAQGGGAGMMPNMMAGMPNMMAGMPNMMPMPAAAAPPANKRRGSTSKSGGRASQAPAQASTALAPYGGEPAGGGYAMVPMDDAPPAAAPPPAQRGEMSYDQRSTIAAGIAKLSANNIGKVVEIIKKSMPGLGQDGQELELDVNQLDNQTLWTLHDFINNCKATRKPAKAKASRGAKSWQQDMERAQQQTQQSLESVRAARGALDDADDGGVDDDPYNPYDTGAGMGYDDYDDLDGMGGF